MLINIIQFIGGILIPYFAENYSYKNFIPIETRQDTQPKEVVADTYGWRVIWDAAYYFGLFSTAYQIIFLNISFTPWHWLGYIIFLSGIGLRILSLKELGKFYDFGIAIKTDHQLVQTGPYRIFRHPLHFGTLLKIVGLAFFSPLWLAIPAVVASLLLAFNINHSEDQTHRQQFGESFKEYYLTSWDIVDLIFWKK